MSQKLRKYHLRGPNARCPNSRCPSRQSPNFPPLEYRGSLTTPPEIHCPTCRRTWRDLDTYFRALQPLFAPVSGIFLSALAIGYVWFLSWTFNMKLIISFFSLWALVQAIQDLLARHRLFQHFRLLSLLAVPQLSDTPFSTQSTQKIVEESPHLPHTLKESIQKFLHSAQKFFDKKWSLLFYEVEMSREELLEEVKELKEKVPLSEEERLFVERRLEELEFLKKERKELKLKLDELKEIVGSIQQFIEDLPFASSEEKGEIEEGLREILEDGERLLKVLSTRYERIADETETKEMN